MVLTKMKMMMLLLTKMMTMMMTLMIIMTMMVGDEVGRGGASAWWDFKSGICNGILN